MKELKTYLYILIILSASSFSSCASNLTISNLRCSNLINPLGIENPHPVLSWEINSEGHNISQSAYHILVSSNLHDLSNDDADIWNSGKVLSGNSTNVSFEGKSLKCWFNKEYLKEWIEHYVISKQGVQTTLDRLYNKDRSYTTDDDRI